MINSNNQDPETSASDYSGSVAQVRQSQNYNSNSKHDDHERKSQEVVRMSQESVGNSPERKKARYSWQVKNKPLAETNDGMDCANDCSIGKVEACPDSVASVGYSEPCSSQLAPNVPIPKTTVSSDTKPDQFSRVQFQEYNDYRFANKEQDVALDEVTNDAITAIDTHEMDGNENMDANVILLLREHTSEPTPSQQRFLPPTLTQNMTSRSVNPTEPWRYTAMPTGRWLLEYSLMRAELDNHINEALELLRHLPDDTPQQAYVSERISLENAGIFQVIKQRGLRKYAPAPSPPINCLTMLRPHNKQQSFVNTVESSCTVPNRCGNDSYTLPVHRCSFETFEPDPATTNDICAARRDHASSGLQGSSVGICKSSEVSQTCSSDTTPSPSFIIDQAVSAVICERGIRL